MYVGIDTVIRAAALITALGVIGGVVVWCFKFVSRQKRQANELKAIQEEQTVMCFGILACLKGLKEQGCNGPVTEALNKMEKHLNTKAHKWEEL